MTAEKGRGVAGYLMSKKIIFAVIAAAGLIFIASLFYYADGIAVAIAKWKIEKAFPGSAVSIESCHFSPGSRLLYSGLTVKREGAYRLRFSEAGISYSIPSLFTGGFIAVRLEDMDLRAGGLAARGAASLQFSPKKRSLGRVDIALDKIEAQGMLVEDAQIEGLPLGDGANVFIKTISYKDARIQDIKGTARLKESTLSLTSLNGRIFNGGISMDIAIELDREGTFNMDLDCKGLDLENIVSDFELQDKFRMTGLIGGAIYMAGKISGIEDIRGTFSTSTPSGTLVITDTRFLENIAEKSGQSYDILMESFENYRYNTGRVAVSQEGDDLRFAVELDGEAGKRTFDVVLHDMAFMKKGEL